MRNVTNVMVTEKSHVQRATVQDNLKELMKALEKKPESLIAQVAEVVVQKLVAVVVDQGKNNILFISAWRA